MDVVASDPNAASAYVLPDLLANMRGNHGGVWEND
jgi:hypothetical protein